MIVIILTMMEFTDICNKLCFKRLGLCSNSDINLLHNGTLKTCICSNEQLMHVSACLIQRQYQKRSMLWN